MKVTKLLVIDQTSEFMEGVAKKNGTTLGICGFVTCAIAKYIANLQVFTINAFKDINEITISPFIEEVMKKVLARRRFELKKYYKIMNDNDRKGYLTDYVANYQIAEYIQNEIQSFKNKQVYFFRQSSYDHPEAMEKIKLQEKQRVTEEQLFKGHRFFYSTFNPYKNQFKEQFEQVLKSANKLLPIIICTDILGHYYTTILFQGQVYILDSLSPFMATKHDSEIVECIQYLYKQSFLIKEKQEKQT